MTTAYSKQPNSAMELDSVPKKQLNDFAGWKPRESSVCSQYTAKYTFWRKEQKAKLEGEMVFTVTVALEVTAVDDTSL